MKKIIIALIIILVGIQFIPAERTNPPVVQDLNPPASISSILRTSCYDCHSNETSWPWYSYIAPMSFLVTNDVKEGRKHLNFSEWSKYDDKKQEKIFEEIIEVIEDGEMPLPGYLLTHPNAKLDEHKIKMLKDWIIPGKTSDESLRYEKH